MKPVTKIRTPYLLFLGDAHDGLAAKTADGIATWRPDLCVGEHRYPECGTSVGLQPMSLAEGVAAGARSLVLGIANRGGVIAPRWIATFRQALDLGMDLASGMHQRLADLPELTERASSLGRELHDVRHPQGELPIGTGLPRSGHRLLTVGSDCSSGKMFCALALEREMRSRGMNADFRATGQTGILITGSGVSIDAVVGDFLAGAIEELAPAGDADHWDLIEGQGSLFHPSFAGVSLGLLHGAQAEALVLCHEPTRTHMRGLSRQPMPDLPACIEANEAAARLTSPDSKVIGIAANTRALSLADAEAYLDRTAQTLDLPSVDTMRNGVAAIVEILEGR